MDIATDIIPSHHRDYNKARALVFSLIKQLELTRQECAQTPPWIGTGYDEDGDIIALENTEPFERAYELSAMIRSNPNAVAILKAQDRLSILEA